MKKSILVITLFILILNYNSATAKPLSQNSLEVLDKKQVCPISEEKQYFHPYLNIREKVIKEANHSIDLMFNYPFYKLPSSTTRTPAAKILYHELSNEKESLDFMMYGIYKQPDIFNQIVLLCNNSNVALRGIVDVNTKGENDYPDTHKLKMMCKYVKTDFSQRDEMQDYYDKKKKLGYLMHNKVFVFSNNHVWTGSTNISSTCSGGFNANVSYLIKDSRVADLYRKEISQMYNEEKFHIDKEKIFQRNLLLEDGTVLDVYFAPNEDILNEAIIPSIHNAKKQYM